MTLMENHSRIKVSVVFFIAVAIMTVTHKYRLECEREIFEIKGISGRENCEHWHNDNILPQSVSDHNFDVNIKLFLKAGRQFSTQMHGTSDSDQEKRLPYKLHVS